MASDPERHARTLAAVQSEKLDAVICGSASEVLLLSGYWPVMDASVAVFSSDGEVMVLTPEDEMEIAQRSSSARLVAYKPEILESLEKPSRRMQRALAAAMPKSASTWKSIGFRMDEGEQPASYAVATNFRTALRVLLQDILPTCSFESCDELLEQQKAVKTSVELDVMQQAAKVAASGFEAVEKVLRPGMREAEVAAEVQAAFEKSTEAMGLQRSYGFFYCMSGSNSAKANAAYARTRQRVIREGDLVMVHANTCADGYWTDITRTYTAGEPLARHREIREAIDEARDAALSAVRPDVTGQQVDKAARDVMQAHGLGEAFTHSTGHGVGFAAANANGLPRIHPKSPDVLQAGMTFNVEPAAYFDGYGGMRHCDVVSVTGSGAQVLTDF